MTEITRRRALRRGAAVAATGTVLGLATGSVAAERGGRSFGRVWANGDLYRTNVVKPLDERPKNEDKIYFVNDGTPASLPPNNPVQAMSPFVSEAAPGDQDWNGGKWTHFSALVVDGVAFDARKPLTSERDVMEAESAGAIEVTLGPPFPEAPPAFFLCPLNGPAKGQPK